MAAQDARIECVTGTANSWIVGDDDEVIVIDPGDDAAAVLDAVGDREILAVICTHGHAGHAAAAIEVAERDEAPVALHPADRLAWREVHRRASRISTWRTAGGSRSRRHAGGAARARPQPRLRAACTARSWRSCSPATS